MQRRLLSVCVATFIFTIALHLSTFAQGTLCINDVTDYSFLNGATNPLAVVHGDFNKDGKQDLATANSGSSNISVVLGNGNGSFNTATNYALPTQAWSMTAADYNNDTYADLAVSDMNGNLSIFLNNTSGGFNAAIINSGYSGMISLTSSDFDQDGNTDIAAVGYWFTYIFKGSGAGLFTAAPGFQTGLNPNYLTSGDVNADGKPDLIVSSKADSAYVFLNTGNNISSVPSAAYRIGNSVQSKQMALADIDQDGDQDIAVALYAEDSLAVLFNTGTGAFNPTVCFKSGYYKMYLTTGDYNGDGKTDIASLGTTLGILLNTGGNFSASTEYYTPSLSMLTTADINNDGNPDIIGASPQLNNCVLMINNGAGVFSNQTPYCVGYAARSLVNADFNKDGIKDVMSCSEYESNASLLLGSNSGFFGPTQYISTGTSSLALAAADFNEDGNPDFASCGSMLSIFSGSGTGSFALTSTMSVGANITTSAQAGDVNNDGHIDLVLGDWNGTLLTYLGVGNGTFSAMIATSGSSSNRHEQLELYDLNKDNNLDVISAASSGTQVHYYPGDGAGHFGPLQTFTTAANPWAVAVGDLNNDGNADLVTGNNGTSNEISVLVAGGVATFTTHVNYSLGSNGIMDVVIADMNGDTYPDIVAAGNDLFILLGNGTGIFAPANHYLIANGIYDLLAMDVNADSKKDVVGLSSSNVVVAVSTGSPTVTINSTSNPICFNSPVTLNGQGAATYTWTGGITDGIAFTPSATTTYTVTGASNGGCTGTSVITVTVLPLPTLSITATSSVVCYGNAETLTASGASTYTWTNSISNGVPFYPTITDYYYVTATDLNGCQNNGSYFVTVDQASVSITPSASAICEGQNVTLTGNGANTYTWSSGVTNGIPFTPTATATYTVTGTNSNNCQASDVITIVVHSLPIVVANATSATVCEGNATTLYGSGASTYTWTNGVTDNVPFYPAFTNVYSVTGTDANNCQNSNSIVVTVNPLPVVTFTTLGFSSPVCTTAGTQTLTGGSPAGGSYSGAGVVSGTNIFLPVLAPATYTLTYTYTDANQCTNTAQDTVSVIICGAGVESVDAVSLHVYPNPANELLYIDGLQGSTTIRVMNLLGVEVLALTVVNDAVLNLYQLSDGIYYLHVEQNGKDNVRKIEIVH